MELYIIKIFQKNRIINFKFNNRKFTKKGFKRKNLNYKKVGDSHCYVLRDYLLKIIKNFMFKSGFVNIDY